MVRARRETKLDKLNKSIHEIMQEIAKDKANYPEYEAMKSKLAYVSEQVRERITNNLKEDE